MRIEGPRVQFLVLPFLPEHQPALGVSSLAAVLRRAGIASAVRYLNLEYGAHAGWDLYHFVGNALPVELLLGELLFTPALWGDEAPPFEEFLREFDHWRMAGVVRKRFPDLEGMMERLRPLYDNSPAVISAWADQVLDDGVEVVGFTTTFQQNVASLALAKELRRRVPSSRLKILFGGANCEADMGRALADQFSFIDHVVSGEAEDVIVDLTRGLLSGTERRPRFLQGPMVRDMNGLPEPEFESYFSAIADTPWSSRANLVAESSRGCWWGAKSHCTFCGLNGSTMSYRSKDAARFVQELQSLRNRYGRSAFMLADNIMDMRYVRKLFPELAADSEGVELFYETKANLRKDQLITMAAGGVSRIQPGIESLSSSILKLMDKGTTALQNIQLLKWSEELRVGLAWNFLTGFPGEAPEEYPAMAGLIEKLSHLPAPTGTGTIRLDRFSPYWRTPERFGIENLRPFWAYDLVYRPLAADARANIAYFFEHDQCRDMARYSAGAKAAVERWMTDYHSRHVTLELRRESGRNIVYDDRDPGGPVHTVLTKAEAALLQVLDAVTHRDAISSAMAAELGEPLPPAFDLVETLDRFLRRSWIVREGDLYLSIVLDRSEHRRVLDLKVTAQLAEFGLCDEIGLDHPGPVLEDVTS